MSKVIAVCISEKRGTEKKNVQKVNVVEGYGIENDAHGGNWHRQISLLQYERIQEFNEKGAQVEYGAFGENIIVEGIDFLKLPIGTRFKCNDVVLELTQKGKQCHTKCEIFYRVGECIMPKQGVFTKVIHGGTIEVGDEFICIE